MKSTEDRYREAGMPAPKGEVWNPHPPKHAVEAAIHELARRMGSPIEVAPGGSTTTPLLDERAHDPAADPAALPELPATAYGPDSVPLDTPDADNTEEQS